MIISNSADLNKLKVGSLFNLMDALKYSEFYIGPNKCTWYDETISEITHIYFKRTSPLYVSKDYVLISNLTILLNITFLEK